MCVDIGDVIADLNSKRGKVVGVSAEANLQILNGHVPLAALFGPPPPPVQND